MATEAAGTLTLISKDDVKISISRKAASLAQILEDLIEDLPESETELPVPLDAVDGATLKIVVDWCEHHSQHSQEQSETFNPSSPCEIPPWDTAFLTFDNKQTIFDVTNAANYMNIETLLDYCIKKVAKSLMGKSTQEMRDCLGIESDYTPEEEEKIRKENEWAYDKSLD
ncbi:E3 ubiquitin ligase complex SCF subunit sconC [Hypoxylon cercidicola]|nr:E3 ubiquitin ligase complex SCF subunit sconC [Hypoxylon cercidicola]